MPYKRRHGKRYGRRRKGPRYTTYGAAKYLARKAWRGVKYIRSMINCEKQFYDVGTAGPTISTSGSVTILSNIAQGDDVGNRKGNSILAKRLYIRGTLSRSAASTSVVNSVRILIFKDLENTGSNPTVTDVLQTASVTSPLNVDHVARYQVLKDKVYTMSLNGALGMNLKYYIPINDHLKYTGSASTDIYKNAIYILLVSDQGANLPSFTYDSRLSFYDN